MRVQPSVKKICRNCKIIRRNRIVPRDLHGSAATSKSRADFVAVRLRARIAQLFRFEDNVWPVLLG